MSDIISPAAIAATLSEYWSPRIIGEVDDSYIKVARLKGEFVWHSHEQEDELFLILKGYLRIELDGRAVDLREGDMFVVPKGIQHRPVAEDECHVLLLERKSTLHTGGIVSDLTKTVEQQLSV